LLRPRQIAEDALALLPVGLALDQCPDCVAVLARGPLETSKNRISDQRDAGIGRSVIGRLGQMGE
jgi:hypothetical protein